MSAADILDQVASEELGDYSLDQDLPIDDGFPIQKGDMISWGEDYRFQIYAFQDEDNADQYMLQGIDQEGRGFTSEEFYSEGQLGEKVREMVNALESEDGGDIL